MAQDMITIDPQAARVSLALPEFKGIEPAIVQRRPTNGTDPTLDYLAFSGMAQVAVVNHQYAPQPMNWAAIDLVGYVNSLPQAATMEKTFEAPIPYARGEASGTLVLFQMKSESDSMACVAYDVRAKSDRLTGFICLPGSAPISAADAKRLVDGIAVKDALPAG